MTDDVFGREEQLARLNSFLDAPVDRLRAMVLEGEPGIGKSTLWRAGVAGARARSFQVLTSRPAEVERTFAHVVVGDLFAHVEREALVALPGPQRRAFEAALLREEPESPVDPRAVGVAIQSLLVEATFDGPVLIAIDDAQWIDPSSAATLGFALRRTLGLPILLLLARRLDGEPGWGPEGLQVSTLEQVRVGPLSLGALELLIHRRLGTTFPRPVLLQVHDVTRGNPFYAMELALARSAEPGRDLALPLAAPTGLDGLIGARLEAIGTRARDGLLLVAAHGRPPVPLLAAAGVTLADLHPASAAGMIEASTDIVTFTHPLLAAAVYHGAPADTRRAAHRRLAEVLTDPVHRGRHLALSADRPDEVLATALDQAAAVAHRSGIPVAAAELCQQALRLTPGDAIEDRHRRGIATARALREAGEANASLAMAVELVGDAPPGPPRAEALILRAECEARPEVSVGLLRQALVDASSASALRVSIHVNLAEIGRHTRGRAWAEVHALASLRLASAIDDDALRSTALSIVALLRFEGGHGDALELAREAHRLAALLGDPRGAWWIHQVMAWTSTADVARDWLERQITEWGDHDEEARLSLLWLLALVEFWSGHWERASAYAAEQRDISIQYGFEYPHDRFPPALIAAHRGEFASAKLDVQYALSLPGGHVQAFLLGVLGICDAWTGNLTAALESFGHAETWADSRGWLEPSLRWWRAEHVEALLQAGRVEEAGRLLADWHAAAERLGRERVRAHATRCRGLLASAMGDLPAAGEHLEHAVRLHEAVDDPFGRARSLVALGVVRRRARQKRSARLALQAALAGFEALGAISWADTARAELARIGGRERIDGLSPSELRVARLAADGRTNREIASALFLGERTVASHLTHVYGKLGIRSRTELARYLAHRDARPPEPGNIPTS